MVGGRGRNSSHRRQVRFRPRSRWARSCTSGLWSICAARARLAQRGVTVACRLGLLGRMLAARRARTPEGIGPIALAGASPLQAGRASTPAIVLGGGSSASVQARSLGRPRTEGSAASLRTRRAGFLFVLFKGLSRGRVLKDTTGSQRELLRPLHLNEVPTVEPSLFVWRTTLRRYYQCVGSSALAGQAAS